MNQTGATAVRRSGTFGISQDFPTVSQIQSISNARSGHRNYISRRLQNWGHFECNCDARSGHLKWTEFGTLWEILGKSQMCHFGALHGTSLVIQNVPHPVLFECATRENERKTRNVLCRNTAGTLIRVILNVQKVFLKETPAGTSQMHLKCPGSGNCSKIGLENSRCNCNARSGYVVGMWWVLCPFPCKWTCNVPGPDTTPCPQ